MSSLVSASHSYCALWAAGLTATAVVLTWLGLRRFQSTLRLPLPPGPKASWFGSVELPKTYQWHTYAQWRLIYGDVIYVRVLGNPIIILNSLEAITDLFERRSSNYSSRPTRTMVNELMGFDWLFSSMPYGPWWTSHRKMLHNYLRPNSINTFHPLLLQETHTLLHNLVDKPNEFAYHLRRLAASVSMTISYGHRIAPEGDEYVALADGALKGLSTAGIFGTFMVDYLPILKHVPEWLLRGEDNFKALARKWRILNRLMLNKPFDNVKQKMAIGIATPCLATSELESGLSAGDQVIRDVCATVYAAGADTTVSAMSSFVLAMVHEPEVQRYAQEEIDRVCGGRLPDFNDRASLPFIQCIVWEALRWNPVTPMGLGRSVTEDDEYKGYHIPKGTTILPNVWAILHDENTYPEPFRFNPWRYLNPEENRKLGINPCPEQAFGFGRRQCPGSSLAVDTMWIVFANVLALFKIAPLQDNAGNALMPPIEYTSASLSRPKPFQCNIEPRSQAAVHLIHQALLLH